MARTTAFPMFLAMPFVREHWLFLRCPAYARRTWAQPHVRT